jgi:DNA-binding transcriptional LysR family regulator
VRSPAVMALQDMALFVEVARARSFTRASKASGIPIATLSRRVAMLEKRVGVRLLERTTRRLTLTEPGRRYLERCERIVQEADIAHEILQEAAERPAGHLRVSMPVEFGLISIAPIIDEFARHYPEITIDAELSPRPANFADEKCRCQYSAWRDQGSVTDCPSSRQRRTAAVCLAGIFGEARGARPSGRPRPTRLHPSILYDAAGHLASGFG